MHMNPEASVKTRRSPLRDFMEKAIMEGFLVIKKEIRLIDGLIHLMLIL